MNVHVDPGCTGKTRYLSKGDAMQCIIRRKRDRRVHASSGRHGIHAYRCRNCKHWHIGSNAL